VAKIKRRKNVFYIYGNKSRIFTFLAHPVFFCCHGTLVAHIGLTYIASTCVVFNFRLTFKSRLVPVLLKASAKWPE